MKIVIDKRIQIFEQYFFYLPYFFLYSGKVVSGLIGTKIMVNEFVAYAELGKMTSFRNKIIEMNLFESYHNGSIPLPSEIGSMIWDVCCINLGINMRII